MSNKNRFRSPISSKVDFDRFGFRLDKSPTPVFQHLHRHDEIELTLPSDGWERYLFGGQSCLVPAQTLFVRWGAVPHGIVESHEAGTHYSLKIPLPWFLGWSLRESFVRQLMLGAVVLDKEHDPGASDVAAFERWWQLMQGASVEETTIVLLEVEARLRRIALRAAVDGTSTLTSNIRGRLGRVERMAAFIADNCSRPLKISEIAESVELHPNSASRLFRKSCGMTILEYIAQQRIWRAQRLLATTDRTISSICFECGFNSVSRFYIVFKQLVGQRPKTYRDSIRKQ